MKKLLILMMLLSFCLLGSARHSFDLNFAGWNSGSDATWNAGTSTLTFTSAWGGADLYKSKDLSGFDKLLIKTTSNCAYTVTLNFTDDSKKITKKVVASSNPMTVVVDLPIDASDFTKMAFQCDESGSIVFREIDASNVIECTIWEGSQDFPTDPEAVALNIKDYCQQILKGDVLLFTVSNGEYDFHQRTINVKSASDDWETHTLANYESIEGNYTQEVTNTVYEHVITNNGMFNIGGKGYVLTKITLIREVSSSIKSELGTFTENGSFNGTLLGKAVAGDYILVRATPTSSYGTYALMENDVSTGTYNYVYDNLIVPLTTEQITTWKGTKDDGNGGTIQCWPYSALSGMKSVTLTLFRPVSSFAIGSIEMATFCPDVEVRVPSGVRAYTAELNEGNSTIHLKRISDGIIPAEEGVIIVGNESEMVEFAESFTGKSKISGNLLKGVTTATVMSGDDNEYVLYNNSGTAEFRLITASTTLKANKAYLDLSDTSAAAARFSITFDDSETAALGALSPSVILQDKKTYSLKGFATNASGKKLLIVNGKKIINK